MDNWTTAGVDPYGLLSGCCGPEIGPRLNQVLSQLERKFRDAKPERKMAACEGLYGGGTYYDSWDIDELYDAGSYAGPGWFQSASCATGTCAGTVKVGGTCFRANEVNYLLWGKALRLCSESMGEWTQLIKRSGVQGERPQYVLVDLNGRPVAPWLYTLFMGFRAVDVWRFLVDTGLSGHDTPAGPSGRGSPSCRKAWAKAGWYGDLSPEIDCQAPGCGTGCCTDIYMPKLHGHIGDITWPPDKNK